MPSLIDDNGKERRLKDEEFLSNYIKHLKKRIQSMETEIDLLKKERLRLTRALKNLKNEIEHFKELPLITATLIEILDEHNQRGIVKSSTGPEFVVNVSKAIAKTKIEPGMNVAINQSTCALMEILPTSKDPLVRAMELHDYIPDISYEDIGGLDDQIKELKEVIELPIKKPELFKKIGIHPPKGILLYGIPGTGKTLLAKAVAHETKTTFIRIIGSELVDKFIGEGARYVREIFQLAKEKAPAIIFIDELDAIGAIRMDDATSGDREVQRTLMQLLSELDGFDARGDVKFIGATNRIDIIDPAFLRPGRFDRLVEIPLPDDQARKAIFKVHMKSLNIDKNLDLDRLVSLSKDVSGADIKSFCTEAGMFAIRAGEEIITEEFFIDAIKKVLKGKKGIENSTNLYL